MPNIQPSISELAAEAGVETFDTALPVRFLYGIMDRFGYNPSGHIVWAYDRPDNIFGKPVGLTTEGKATVASVERLGATFWGSLK
jgi:hypothetical protein